MFRPLVISFALLTSFTISCDEVDQSVNKIIAEGEEKRDYISSVMSLNGTNLEFKQHRKNCGGNEFGRLVMCKNSSEQIEVSFFTNDIQILNRKVFDSSFQIYIKSFIYECDKLLKDTSTWNYRFANYPITTMQISDGLDIIEVRNSIPNSRSPFDDLVYAFCNNYKLN